MYTIKIASNLEQCIDNTSEVAHVLIGWVSTNSFLNIDLASAKKTDN